MSGFWKPDDYTDEELNDWALEAVRRVRRQRAQSVLRFARFSGPTGDIDEILADIDLGRGIVPEDTQARSDNEA